MSRILYTTECSLCNLCNFRTNIVHGEGNIKSDIIIVGEGPGFHEDRDSKPFIGKSGILLRTTINNIMDIKDDELFFTNAVRCRPPNNRTPIPIEVESCKNYLVDEILNIKPKILVTSGLCSTKIFVRGTKKISDVRRNIYQHELCNIVIPIAHPASVLHGSEAEYVKKINEFEKDILFVNEVYRRVKDKKQIDREINTESNFNDFNHTKKDIKKSTITEFL